MRVAEGGSRTIIPILAQSQLDRKKVWIRITDFYVCFLYVYIHLARNYTTISIVGIPTYRLLSSVK